MQFFKNLRKNYQDAYAKTTTDSEFDDAEKDYFNVESAILRLEDDVQEYAKHWDKIVTLRNQIAGDYLYFYGSKTKNHDLGLEYMELNRDVVEVSVHKHQSQIKKMVDHLQSLRQEFTNTKMACDERKEMMKIFDRKRYALSQYTAGKKFDVDEAARKHAKLARVENDYKDKTRDLRSVFSLLKEKRGHLMDQSFQEFMQTDAMLTENLYDSVGKIRSMESKIQSRDAEDIQSEQERIRKRGDLERRRLSTWTAARINKLKQEYQFQPDAKKKSNEPSMYYFKQDNRAHPLLLSLQDTTDFAFMHELMSPDCKKHPTNPDCKEKPYKVRTKKLQMRTFCFGGGVMNRRRNLSNRKGSQQRGKRVALAVYEAKAAFAPESQSGQFLSFEAGFRLYLIERDPSGWMFGQLDSGVSGWFPETFVDAVYEDEEEESEEYIDADNDFVLGGANLPV